MVILRFSDDDIRRQTDTVKLPPEYFRSAPPPAARIEPPSSPDHEHTGRYQLPEESAPRLLGPWVISVMLHGGVVILALFFVATQYLPSAEDDKTIVPNSEYRDWTEPASLVYSPIKFRHEIPIDRPDTQQVPKGDVLNDLKLEKDFEINTIGTKGAPGRQGIPDGDPTIFGPISPGDPGGPGGANSIVYVIDASGSLIDTLPFVRLELVKAIQKLHEGGRVFHNGKPHDIDPIRFTVIFYQKGEAKEVNVPHRGMKRATPEIKRMVCQWVTGDAIVPQGNSNPLAALERAISYKPDLIYILSDNITGRSRWQVEQDRLLERIDQLKREHRTQKTVINTIQYLYPDPMGTLKRIAAEHGGRYRFVSEQALGI